MKISQSGIDLLKQFEGLSLDAYQDSGGTWTIGYGQTYYEDGKPVQPGDHISLEQAYSLYANILPRYEEIVNKHIGTLELTQNQFDALVSFAFNLGLANLKSSTLLKKVNVNPNDRTIVDEFLKWVYAKKVFLEGLHRRRQAEANLYFKNI